jgi:hypothetical protein
LMRMPLLSISSGLRSQHSWMRSPAA